MKKGISGIFIIRVAVCLALVAHPFFRIHAKTSVRATREQTYPELYYGDMIHAFFKTYPSERLTVVYDGYNSHALFYTRAYEWKGHSIRAATSGDRFVTGENLLFCEPAVYANVLNRYKLVPVFESDGRVLATVAFEKTGAVHSALEKGEQMVTDKIREILANDEWKKSIEEKAVTNKTSFERQLRLDAIYVLQSENKLSGAEAAALSNPNN
jgi:hypothetical protein